MPIEHTKNFNLAVVPAEDTDTTFKSWRVALDAPSDSNMTKIDEALMGTMSHPISITKEELDKTWKRGWYTCSFNFDNEDYGDPCHLIEVTNQYDFDGCYCVAQVSYNSYGSPDRYRYAYDESSCENALYSGGSSHGWSNWGDWDKHLLSGTALHPWRVDKEALDQAWRPGWYICNLSTDGEQGNFEEHIIQVVNLVEDDSYKAIIQYARSVYSANAYRWVRSNGLDNEYDIEYKDLLNQRQFGEWHPETVTPRPHSTKEKTYGLGTQTEYGHVKLSDDAVDSTAAQGVAATPHAVQIVEEACSAHGDTIATDTKYGHVCVVNKVQSGYDVKTGYVPSVSAVWTSLLEASTRAATLTIGNETSGHTAEDCDYLCDGTADQDQINLAIKALDGKGGTILLLSGTYNISAEIIMDKQYVTLAGEGKNATILRRMFQTESTASAVIRGKAKHCTVRDLTVDGNGTTFVNNDDYAMHNILVENNIEDWTIDSIISKNANTNGSEYCGCGLCMLSVNIEVPYDTCHTVINSSFSRNGDNGIYVCGNRNRISGNNCDNNGSYGIAVVTNKSNKGYNSITENNCSNNTNSGIYLTGDLNTISNNICHSNGDNGIYIYDNKSQDNVITNNICHNNGYCGMRLDGGQSTIVGNMVNSNEEIGILLDWGGSNAVVGNVANYENFTADIKLSEKAMCNFIAGNFLKGAVVDDKTANMNQKFGNMLGNNVQHM